MLTHTQIWAGVDGLAARYGLTASGLARKAGLDPTTFNRSKRVAPDGRQRWPSTESIAKVLEATGASLSEFIDLIRGSESKPARALPCVGFTAAQSGEFFDTRGHPLGADWHELMFPNLEDENCYALEIAGYLFEPFYRDGDIIIASPALPIRRGHRILVRTGKNELLIGELKRRTAKTVELKELHQNPVNRTLSLDEVVWMSRIVWASQ
jgi:phage repressor protein C with HTH and peptisase S24 domain